VNIFDGLEGAVKTAVQSSPAAASLETQTVAQVGGAAQTLTTNVLSKILPDGAVIAPEVAAPFFAGLEGYINHFFQNGTTTTTNEGTPPAAAA
jgi:hypothetical protein